MDGFYCDTVDVDEDFHLVDYEPNAPRMDPWSKEPFEYIQDDPEYQNMTAVYNTGSMYALSKVFGFDCLLVI
jgi:hypothetical protein